MRTGVGAMANAIQKEANVGDQEEKDENMKGGNFDDSGKQDAGSGVKGDSGLKGIRAEEEEKEAPKGGDPGASQGGEGGPDKEKEKEENKNNPDEKKEKEKGENNPDKKQEESAKPGEASQGGKVDKVEVPKYVRETIRTLEERVSEKNVTDGEGAHTLKFSEEGMGEVTAGSFEGTSLKWWRILFQKTTGRKISNERSRTGPRTRASTPAGARTGWQTSSGMGG